MHGFSMGTMWDNWFFVFGDQQLILLKEFVSKREASIWFFLRISAVI